MSNELRVLTAHLGELAAKQGEAAATIAAATSAVHGAGAAVAATHGVISSATAAAVTKAEGIRGTAGTRIEGESRTMQDALTRAAANYDGTDVASANRIGGILGAERAGRGGPQA